jgi:hypothetical protein
VFKIDTTSKLLFNNNSPIRPIGIKFNFTNNVIDGDGKFIDGLKDLTKGFFIVRQKRLPTILAQAIGIGTSELAKIPIIQASRQGSIDKPPFYYSYIAESFLSDGSNNYPKLSPHIFTISDSTPSAAVRIKNNALLCPEASIRRTVFNTFFNSSEYTLKAFKYNTSSKVFNNYDSKLNNYSFKGLIQSTDADIVNTELTLIEPGIDLIRNTNFEFSSKLGDPIIAYKHGDPILGDYNSPENIISSSTLWNTTSTKVRGVFNTFVGCSVNTITHGRYYNIFQKDYSMNY